jgi:hypothetical protein
MKISQYKSLVINPAAGNEPIILGAYIALAINDLLAAQGRDPLDIIVPIISKRQKDVLQDELQDHPGIERIMLDEQAGLILANVLTSQGNFIEHIRVLHDEYDTIQAALNDHFGKQATQLFTVYSLTEQAATMNPQGIVGSLDTGGRVIIDTHYRDFAFPVLTSELIRATKEANTYANNPLLTTVENRARAEDRTYRNRFISLVHTLAGPIISDDPTISMRQKFKELLVQSTATPAGEVIFTPPMKHVMPAMPFDGVVGEGVYAMLSGTDQGAIDTFQATIKAAKGADLTVYTNPWAGEIADTVRISPKALHDPRIKAVVGRAGWGTGWQMLTIGKSWLVIPPQQGDDPEIQFNHQVIERLGIGSVIDSQTFDAAVLEDYIRRFGPRVRELRELTTQRFGTSDGIAYIAQRIVASYAQAGL